MDDGISCAKSKCTEAVSFHLFWPFIVLMLVMAFINIFTNE